MVNTRRHSEGEPRCLAEVERQQPVEDVAFVDRGRCGVRSQRGAQD